MIAMTLFYIGQAKTNARDAARAAQDKAAFTTQRLIDQRFSQFDIQGCRRIVTLNAAMNASSYADFLLLRAVIMQTERLHHRMLNSQNALVRAERAQLWVPLTDCYTTVPREGSHYQLPHPIRFVTRLPPRSALTVPPPAR